MDKRGKPLAEASKGKSVKPISLASALDDLQTNLHETADRAAKNDVGGVGGSAMLNTQPTKQQAAARDTLITAHPTEFYAVEQVRDSIDQQKVLDRRASMEAHGQIKAITVFPRDDRGYRIITGEYRWRAAMMDPPMKLDAIIKYDDINLKPYEVRLKQLAENDEAVRLNIYEMAINLREAMKEGGIESYSEIARLMGWARENDSKYGTNKVSEYLSLFSLDDRGINAYRKGYIKDKRSIPILIGIKELSSETYDSIIKLIESGQKVTRKSLEDQRSLLQSRGQGRVAKNGAKEGNIVGSDGKKSPGGAAGRQLPVAEIKAASTSSLRVYFRYNNKLAELIYRDAEPGSVYVRMKDSPADEILIACDEIQYSHFEANPVDAPERAGGEEVSVDA